MCVCSFPPAPAITLAASRFARRNGVCKGVCKGVRKWVAAGRHRSRSVHGMRTPRFFFHARTNIYSSQTHQMPVEEGSWWDGMVASVFGIPCWDPNKQPNSRALPGAVTAAAEGNPESAEGNRECKPAFKITVLGPVPPSQRSSTPAPSFLLGAAARGSIADSTASQSSAGHDDEPEEPEEPPKPKPSLPWFNVKRVRVHAVELVGQ